MNVKRMFVDMKSIFVSMGTQAAYCKDAMN